MTDAAYPAELRTYRPELLAPAGPRLSITRLQNLLLWLTAASSSLIFMEPSPYEFFSLITIAFLALTGLAFRPALLPLVVLLICINMGFSIASADLFSLPQPILTWVLTSWYLAVTCIAFALALCSNTEQRLAALTRGVVLAGILAAGTGIAGYAGILHDTFTLYGRARGTFKDPNVMGAFLLLPALVVMQRVVAGNLRQMIVNGIFFMIIGGGIFLSFSRAAWGILVLGGVITMALMFITTGSSAQRTRIVAAAIAIMVLAAGLLVVLLSLDSVADLFKTRASLSQGYDMGEQGRFGRHILGAVLALDKPWGLGPLQFAKIFPEDPHNSYLNAFMSGGWITGLSYLLLVLLTLIYGLRTAFIPAPWRSLYLPIYASFVATAIESAIIDTDHWRHYFMIMGMTWGLIAASAGWQRQQAGRRSRISGSFSGGVPLAPERSGR